MVFKLQDPCLLAGLVHLPVKLWVQVDVHGLAGKVKFEELFRSNKVTCQNLVSKLLCNMTS